MDRTTKLSILRGVRVISHFNERTGQVSDDTVTLLTETGDLTFEDRGFEWIAPELLVNRNGGRQHER